VAITPDRVMEEWTCGSMTEFGQSFFLYISNWCLGFLSPISGCALDTAEDKFTFPLVWFVIPSTRERDDHVVTVTEFLQYISAKDSDLSGNTGYINYTVQKPTSVSPSAKKILDTRTRKNWALLRFLGICH